MNIAYILNATVPTGGATKAFINMLEGVMQYGVRPFVVVPDKDGVYLQLQKMNIPTLAVTYRASAYPPCQTPKQRLLFIFKLAARIIANHRATKILTTWLKENKIDIVHSNTGVVRIGFDAAQKARIPHVYHIREYADKIGIHYFPTKASFVNQLGHCRSYSICITKSVQDYYHQVGKDNLSRVIYDGVFSELPAMPTAQNKNYFLYAGRIQPAKGLDLLLEAYKQYADKSATPIHLKVAGSNGDDAYYQKQLAYIKDNGLTELVELLGNVDDITSLMREARALIVSSPFEGFGFCMPEAMQQGSLVIGRNTSGTKEQLDNALDMTGQEIALRYETAEQLTGLLSEVADNPLSHYDNYTRKAFDVVNQLYTKENHAKKVYEFYNAVLNGKDI